MEKEYLSKKELENKFNLIKAKYHRIDKIRDCILNICIGALLIETIMMMGNALVLNNIHVGYAITFVTTIGISLSSMSIFTKKKDKIREEYINIKKDLEDIISMDFEKKRYALEKKYSNTTSNNDLIKSIQEEKELLEKYKQDLNQYCIYRVNDELTNEINTRNYTLQKLNQLR